MPHNLLEFTLTLLVRSYTLTSSTHILNDPYFRCLIILIPIRSLTQLIPRHPLLLHPPPP